MGSFNSTQNEFSKRSNVKLQAQQMVAYDGSSIKWHSWNKKMKAAIGAAGMLRIIEDKKYAESNPVDSETIFHLLQVATADGQAAHLVDMHENNKDGYAAYQELMRWFEGDELTTETAEDVRSKMDKLNLSTRNTAGQYINSFLQHKKHLEELKEEYTPSKTVTIFLTQITDPDYASTVEHCLENKLQIRECIDRIRAKERRLDRSRSLKRRAPVIIRRQTTPELGDENQKVVKLEDHKTESGYYVVPNEIWHDLSNADKSYVKSQNGKLRRRRRNEDDRDSSPRKKSKNNISPRRTTSEHTDDDAEEKPNARKTVQFQDVEDETTTDGGNNNSKSKESKNIVQRRGAFRFRTVNDE